MRSQEYYDVLSMYDFYFHVSSMLFSVMHSVNTSEISQCSQYEQRDSIVCEVKYYFITLVISNVMLFNKT
jgi:hypothetical protein